MVVLIARPEVSEDILRANLDRRSSAMPVDLTIARELIDVGRRFDARSWVLGTSGNFSVVLSDNPLRLAITASGTAKGHLSPDHILEMDEAGRVLDTVTERPSAEARLHVEIVRSRGARAVLHTHSLWSTILSDRHASRQGLEIEGYEMLKGLAGVTTHQHREWIPILENDQDMSRLSEVVHSVLHRHQTAHAFLLRRHGMYTWGRTLDEAVRHVEIVEFLLEVVGRCRD
jgi:methylthioribulose-1-phosphate dehydratase